MNASRNTFKLNYKTDIISVEEINDKYGTAYGIQFPDKRPNLFITIATNINKNKFWTSLPGGREQEAEEIGALIAQHLQLKL